MTNSPDALIAAAKNIKDFDCKEKKVAKVGAIHTEGPYFSFKYKGAQPEEHIKNPSLHEMEKLYEASGGLLKLISLAPERDGAIDFIKEASKKYKIDINH